MQYKQIFTNCQLHHTPGRIRAFGDNRNALSDRLAVEYARCTRLCQSTTVQPGAWSAQTQQPRDNGGGVGDCPVMDVTIRGVQRSARWGKHPHSPVNRFLTCPNAGLTPQ